MWLILPGSLYVISRPEFFPSDWQYRIISWDGHPPVMTGHRSVRDVIPPSSTNWKITMIHR